MSASSEKLYEILKRVAKQYDLSSEKWDDDYSLRQAEIKQLYELLYRNKTEANRMIDKLNEIKAYLEKNLPIYEADSDEISAWMEDDFNPCDASGGNFDDAYFLGESHGDTSGRLNVLYEIKAIIDKEDSE